MGILAFRKRVLAADGQDALRLCIMTIREEQSVQRAQLKGEKQREKAQRAEARKQRQADRKHAKQQENALRHLCRKHKLGLSKAISQELRIRAAKAASKRRFAAKAASDAAKAARKSEEKFRRDLWRQGYAALPRGV